MKLDSAINYKDERLSKLDADKKNVSLQNENDKFQQKTVSEYERSFMDKFSSHTK